MPAERIVNDVRKLGFVVAVLVGLALGGAAPALAETAASDVATACGAVEAVPGGTGEWAVPPSPGQPGEPY